LPEESGSTKPRLKVIVETSVLIGASIYIVAKELETTRIIKDPHYERSTQLIDILRKNVKRRIGVFTQTLANQAHYTLRDAVGKCLEREKCNPENLSAILNHCGFLLERTLEILVREPIDSNVKDRFMTDVGQMYALLLQRTGLVTKDTIRSMARERAQWRVSPRYRKYVVPDEIRKLNRSYLQLTLLKENPPSTSDCEILAEAATLYEAYSEEMPTELYLASNDSSHFSPRRFDDGSFSNQVTKQIEESFNIKCDWPENIVTLIK